MGELIDHETSLVPNTLLHRNPMMAGWLCTLVLLISLLVLSWYLYSILQLVKYRNQQPLPIEESNRLLLWVWNGLIVALVLVPPIVTQYFYRTGREIAEYGQLLKRGAFVSFWGLFGLFVVIDRFFTWGNGADARDVVFGLTTALFMGVVMALLVNLVLSLFFKKTI